MYSILFSEGKDQVRLDESNIMPRTFPTFDSLNALSFKGQSGASSMFRASHISEYSLVNSSHHEVFSGATVGTLSIFLCTSSLGMEQWS